MTASLTGAEQAETHPCECPACRCPNPAGGSLWEGADGSCWDCWHGTHGHSPEEHEPE